MISATVKALKRGSPVCQKECFIKYLNKYYSWLSSFPLPYSENPSFPNLPTQITAQHLKLYAVHFLPQFPDLSLRTYSSSHSTLYMCRCSCWQRQ